jgi:hypothetical protein
MIHTEEHEKKEKHGMYVTYGTMEQQHIYIYIYLVYMEQQKRICHQSVFENCPIPWLMIIPSAT